jgi:hypothetical protein
MSFDFKWFKASIEPKLAGCKLKFDLLHSDSDTDYINRVEILNSQLSAEIMFYSDGKLYIHIYSHEKEMELLNVLIDQQEEKEKNEVFEKLQELL